MTWEDVITEASKGIEQIQTFMAEDPANADKYDYKLAILQWYKQEAIRQQNRMIHTTLNRAWQK